MQLLFDFLPVIAFFVGYKLSGNNIFVATAVLIVAVIVQTAVQWLRHRKVSQMALISGALVLVFGGLTLADPRQAVHPVESDGRELAVRGRVPGEPFLRRPADHAADHGRERAAGAPAVAAAELGVDRLLRRDGRAQPVRRVQLPGAHLGQLQARTGRSGSRCCSRWGRASGSPPRSSRKASERRRPPPARAAWSGSARSSSGLCRTQRSN